MEPATTVAQEEGVGLNKTYDCLTPDATTACLSKESSIEKNAAN